MGKRRVGVKPEPLPHDVRLYKLLTQVAFFYTRRFDEEIRARQYLAQRSINDAATFKRFHAGYCDGSLHDVLPFDEQVSAGLTALGLVKENGKELFRECLTVPLWSLGGTCVGMYGRRLFDSEVRHLYLPGARHGLVNLQGVCAASDIILTESIIDAMSLYAAGVKNVLACYGTGGFTSDHWEALAKYKPKKVAVCFDGDESGERAARELADELVRELRGTIIETIALPKDQDPNGILASAGVSGLRRALAARTAHPFSAASAPVPAAEEPAPLADAPKREVASTPQGLTLHCGNRIYEVKASVRQGTQLRATLKASKASEGERFELATIDLYSHRSRDWFAGLCAELFAIEPREATADLNQVLAQLERAADAPVSAPTRVELTDTERDEALALLRRPTLVDDVLEAFEHVGYADEVTNKQLGYLVATSRKLERPLSLLIESRSSAGKSALQDAVLAFVPEEECLKYSRITDQALFYTGENALEQKLLVLEEAVGMGGSAYSIRALQSGEALKVAATGKDPTTGKMRTEEYTVKARTAVMMTTTDPNFDEETRSRFIRATVNESPELTRRILEVQRHAETIEGIALKRRAERVKTMHRNAQRLLKNVTIANPFAPQLTFPATSIQARRDHKKYLGLIQTVALLHQAQRPTKTKSIYGEKIDYIEVELKDIAIANRIARDVLVHGHGGVTPQARQLFARIREMVTRGTDTKTKDNAPAFTRRRLREFTGWSDWQVRTHLTELTELEYLTVRQGAFGKEYVYVLSDTHLLEAVPGFGLTDVDAISAALNGHATKTRRPQLAAVHA